MTAVAQQLGVSPTQLQSELKSGQSLSEVAQAAGISSDQLNATVTTALQGANLPPGTNIAAIASRLEKHVGGHHHHGGGGAAPAGATPNPLDPATKAASSLLNPTSSSGSSTDTYA
jgi:lambda repressor-like predicted transcriptional regulator